MLYEEVRNIIFPEYFKQEEYEIFLKLKVIHINVIFSETLKDSEMWIHVPLTKMKTINMNNNEILGFINDVFRACFKDCKVISHLYYGNQWFTPSKCSVEKRDKIIELLP